MADRIVRKLRLYYISGSIVLLLLEIFIALFMRDSFVRPFLGDFLVVILLYMIIRSFFPIGAPWLPAGVFAFSVLVEILQFFHIVDILHLSDNRFMSVLIGGVFDWKDILAYFLGCLVCAFSYLVLSKAVSQKLTGDSNKEDKAPKYDSINKKPVIKCSICNGEQVAGFVDLSNGNFEDVMLIRCEADLKEFCRKYGIVGQIEKIY